MNFFRRRGTTAKSEKSFVACATCLSPKLIEPHTHRRTIQPAFGSFTLRLPVPPQLQKHLDRQFFRPRRIPHNSRDPSSYSLVLSAKDAFEIERRLVSLHLSNSLARCIHNITTPLVRTL